MDTLQAMRVFTAVVDAGAFARAADNLNISTTATSRHVADLEKHLGAQLLQRSTRRLHLTEIGSAYYERAKQILADVEEAEALAHDAVGRPKGTLRISLPLSFGLRYIAPQLADFCNRYPELQVEVSFADRQVDLVEEGIDVALRITREITSPNLIARPLAPVRLTLCAAPAYLARVGTPQVPDDLRQHDCLTYVYASSGDTMNLFRDGERHSVPVRGSFRSNNGDMLRLAALAGRGIVLQPTFLVGDDLRAGTLVPVLPNYTPAQPTAYAVYLGGARRLARVKAFVEYISGAVAAMQPVWDEGL